MPLMVTLMNLIGAYLRYLPFSQNLSKSQTKELWKRLIIWSIISTIILEILFNSFTVNIFKYKILLYFIWMPYLLISLTIIKNKILQHIFVVGMQGIWILFLHSLSGTTVIILQENNLITNEFSNQLLHLSFYFTFFVIFLPLEQRLFKNLLPAEEFFKLKQLAKYITFLPITMYVGYLILMLDDALFQSWSERMAKLILLFVFFIIYRSIMAASKYIYENLINQRNYQRLKQQLISIRDYDSLMQENQEKIAIMRHDLRHHYRLIYLLLENNAVDEAMKHIETQEKALDETKINRYCYAPLINSALTIYFRQAQESGIKIEQKINLPRNFETDENDLAILLSNLLENAVRAGRMQKSGNKVLKVKVQHNNKQCVLEMSNFCDKVIQFDDDGLPKTTTEGHGIGMLSLRSFIKKYNAYVDFSQVDNRVILLMYWRDDVNS